MEKQTKSRSCHASSRLSVERDPATPEKSIHFKTKILNGHSSFQVTCIKSIYTRSQLEARRIISTEYRVKWTKKFVWASKEVFEEIWLST